MSTPEASWLVVFRPDGVIVEVSGGAPADWVGENLRESQSIPASICA